MKNLKPEVKTLIKKSHGIRIVGKLDIETVKRKPSKKGKGKKGKVEEPVEELFPEPLEAVPPVPVIENS